MSIERRERAKELFLNGYNCSQSVFAAYADKLGMEEETALRVSASFGAGMGRMREVCGTISGMLLVAGMETGATQGKDADGKAANYALVQKLAGEFRDRNGTIICRELLGLVPKGDHSAASSSQAYTETKPEARTEEYYKKRPCLQLIMEACDIIDELIYQEPPANL